MRIPGWNINRRRAFERWLWSGGRFRTFIAKHLPMYFADTDYINPKELKKRFKT